jgi:hypothetical protein
MVDPDDRPTWTGAHLTTVQQLARAIAVPRLEVTVEREAGHDVERAQVLSGDVFRLGSHPSNDLVLDDRKVSRFHCQLSRGDAGWVISDSGSMNGTCVNGVRVRDADLPRPACRIEIGDSALRIRELGSESVTEVPAWTSFGELYGESMAMRQLFAVLDRVAKSESTVLIEGESGTGKELAATEIARPTRDRALHHRGLRLDLAQLDRERAVRSREGLVYRRRSHAGRGFRGGERWDDLLGRDRRDAAGDAAQALARARGARDPPDR